VAVRTPKPVTSPHRPPDNADFVCIEMCLSHEFFGEFKTIEHLTPMRLPVRPCRLSPARKK